MKQELVEHDVPKSNFYSREDKEMVYSSSVRNSNPSNSLTHKSQSVPIVAENLIPPVTGSTSTDSTLTDDAFEDDTNEVKHEWVWVSKTSNSSLEFKTLELLSIPCVILQAIIRVCVKDGVIYSTNVRLDDILERTAGNCDSYIRDFSPSRRSSIDELRASLRPLATTFDEDLQIRLHQIAAAVIALRRVFYAHHSIGNQKSLENGDTLVDLTMTVAWKVMISPVSKTFESFSCFNNLSNHDQDILRREATAETVILSMVSSFDDKTNSIIHYGLKNQVTMNIRLRMIDEAMKEETFFYSLRILIRDFDANLRKDETVMALLSCLCLFKERANVEDKLTIRRERALFLELLDQYIQFRLSDWTSPYQLIWDRIHQCMARVSSLKLLFENMAVNRPVIRGWKQ